ncbi:hypothetical protein H1230_15225 [Paenibacillus sp. 19GGS1-52]|uniref:hypothetical protein n=1 Tax=Paenibacillus sp. 19GGS1-52 TaxID=2758563 RepID=UPI001EFB9976|nr:hypothetical protein [Paenibacillus sp. 19GGS1-52]ULO09998.1 hypothetical protein H1230_15225 [Paenibacillus sp. 19GGS1-52]
MNNSKIRTLVDFKVDTLGKLSNLLLNNELVSERKVNLLTAFGSIQGNVSPNSSNKEDLFNLKSLMDDVIVDEYISYLESEHPDKNFNYNFIVLDNVIVRPFANYELAIEYKQLIVYADQITAFNFL